MVLVAVRARRSAGSGSAPAAGSGDGVSGLDDQGGGVFGCLAGDLWQDGDVGVGGQDDAAVAELILDGFEFGAGGQTGLAAPWRRCRRMDGSPAASQSWRKWRVSRSGAIGSPLRVVKT